MARRAWLPAAIASAAVASALLLSSGDAAACWDGMAAHGDGVSVSTWGTASWSPRTAREVALWVTRLEAIVPDGTTIEILNSTVLCDGPACPEVAIPEIRWGDLADAFDRTAAALGVSPAEARRARALPVSLYTVQVFAGAAPAARANRERIHALRDEHALDLSGFYTEGGFPGIHPVAHILHDARDASAPYRVVVGAHRTIAEAQEAAAQLRALGVPTFVRTMPAGAPFEEPVSSSGEG